MKVIVVRGNLKDALSSVERSVGESQNLPILQNILLQAQQNEIKIVATNLELATTALVGGKAIEEGRVSIPAAVFIGTISNLQSERINLERKGNDLEVKTDNYEALIKGLPPEEFPLIPKIESKEPTFTIQGAVLRDAINQIISSAQTTSARPELNGVLVNFQTNQTILTATDSFRLAEKTLGKGGFEAKKEEQLRVLVPIRTASEVMRIIGPNDTIKVFFDKNQVLFATDRTTIISRLVEGTFPNYEAIVPKQFDAEAVVNREEFLSALKLAGVFTGRVHEVRIKATEGKRALEVYSGDHAAGQNKYVLSAKTKGTSKDIGFNWRYLSDGLRSVAGDEVFLGMNDDNKPAVLKSPGDASHFYLLMPILKA